MNVILRIPDDVAQRLGTPDELERTALEALAAEEFRRGRLSKQEIRRLLGFETRVELDAFLKAHGVFENVSMADLERERQVLDRLGI